ncbi:MAG: gas vesicle protein [Thermodesulfobacteriota bacterium]
MRELELDSAEHVTLCEALDRILNKGAVVVGEVTISVANVDLIYLGLQIVLTSIESSEALKASSYGGYRDSCRPAGDD